MSNSIKGILNFTNSMIKAEDIKKNRDEFVDNFIPKNLSKKQKAKLKDELICHILDKKDYYEEIGYSELDYQLGLNSYYYNNHFCCDILQEQKERAGRTVTTSSL